MTIVNSTRVEVLEGQGSPAARPGAGAWDSFTPGAWQDEIDVRDFLQKNYTPYLGDADFLSGATARTTGIWTKLVAMFPEERAKGVYDVDATTPASITAHAAGYIDRENELIVGLQTDAPLKRAIMPFGGWRMVATALTTYGYAVPPELETIFTKYRKTHNDGVFDVYPSSVKRARQSPDHRTARCLWARPHHRRLPPGRPLRRRRSDRRQEAGASEPRPALLDRGRRP